MGSGLFTDNLAQPSQERGLAGKPRIEYPGALLHVIARGNARQAILRDDHDRKGFLDGIGGGENWDWLRHAHCVVS